MTVATINFPTSLDTAGTLIQVVNKASSTIGAGGVNTSVTTIPVASAASAPSSGIAWCGNEAILYESKDATNLLTCTRHFDGTATESHAAGDTIYFSPIIAAHHRVHSDAIIAIETLLGAAGVNVKPGGSNTQVQFNDSGAFGGDAGLVYDKAADALTVGGLNTAQSFRATGNISAGTGSGAELIYSSGAYLFAYTRPSGPYLPLNLDGIPININAQGSGNVVINTTAGNFDTIAKGDTDVNLLYVKASTDRVGIGMNNPLEKLHVTGNIALTGYIDSPDTLGAKLYLYSNNYGIGTESSQQLYFVDAPSKHSFRTGSTYPGVEVVSIASAGLTIQHDNTSTANELTMYSRNPTGAYYNLFHLSRWGTVGAGGTPDNETISQFRWEGLNSGGTYAMFGTFDMNIGVNSATGAGGAYQFSLYTAAGVNQTMLAMDTRVSPPITIANVSLQDIDFVAKGDLDANLLYVDASTDRVGIGTNTPQVKFDVNGTVGTSLVDFPSSTGHKLDLYDTSYAIGVESGELRISAGTATTDKVAFTHSYGATPFFAVSETTAIMTLLAGTGTRLVTASSTGVFGSVAFDADLSTLSVPASTTISTFGATLVDDADNTTARTTLGLGSIATQASSAVSITGGSITGITDLAVADGGTGSSTAAAARTALGMDAGAAGDIWVEKAGDTMTGDLIISKATPVIRLQTSAAGEQTYLALYDQATLKWLIRKTVTTHDFSIYNQNLGFEAFTISSAASLTSLNSAGIDADTVIKGDVDANLFYVDASVDSIGIGTATPSSWFDMKASTAARASMLFPNGALLTTPVKGAIEVGANANDSIYFTPNTTVGRGQLLARHFIGLQSSGSAIGPTVADFFGATTSMPLSGSQYYELYAVMYFTKSTAGTVTVTVLHSGSWSLFAGSLEIGPATGGVNVFGSTQRAHVNGGGASTVSFPASPSLTTGVSHLMVLRAQIRQNAAGNIRIQVTSSAGTVTPNTMSYYTINGMTNAFTSASAFAA